MSLSNKKITLSLVAVAIIATIVFSFMRIGGGETEGTATIGAVLPLTGDAATFGKNTVQGAELAIDLAIEAGMIDEGAIELIAEDSRGEASQAVSAVRKLIDIDKVTYLIGDVTSAGTHGIVPIVTTQSVPLGSPSASDPALSGASPFFFRVWPSDDFEALVIAGYAAAQNYRSVAVLYANTDYGVAMTDEFTETAAGYSIDVLASIGVDRETMNFRPVIQRLKSIQVDALFVVMYPEDWSRLLRQMREAKLEVPLLATATFEDPLLLSERNAAGVVFASPAQGLQKSAARQRFETRYQEKFGEEPGVLSDAGYDLAMILIEAHLAVEGAGAAAVMEYIYGLENYAGVSGDMSFNEDGDVEKPYALKTVEGGEFVWIEQ